MKSIVWFLALAACGCRTATAATLHVDRFDSTVQGWAGGAVTTHEVLGGAGDGTGYLRVPSGSNLAAYNSDARWTGNYSTIGAARLIVDLRVPIGSPELAMRAVVFGPTSLQQRYITASAQTIPADGVWRKYTFSLADGDLIPSRLENPFISYSETMGSVLRIMLRHNPEVDWGGSTIMGEFHVDNAELATGPLPGDFDGNGLVNGADLTDPALGWKQRFGEDLDGNDFLTWQRALNMPSVSPVPEPATFAAAFPLLGAALTRRRARRAA